MTKKKTNEKKFNKNLLASFRDNLEQAKLKLALLKENFEYQKWFDHFLEWLVKPDRKYEGWPVYMFERFGLVGLRFFIHSPNWKNILDLINPRKDIIIESDTSPLARLFYDYAIVNIEVGKIRHPEGGKSIPIEIINKKGLKDSERIYKIDLTKKKSQITKEFKEYIERVYLNKTDESIWIANNERDRKEAWGHLEVWKRRRKRESFSKIAKDLEISPDAAKKRYYRAYELINWQKYDPSLFKRDYWEIRKVELKRDCSTCTDHPKNGGECNTLCPDMLGFVDQDYKSQHDMIGDKEDASLFFKNDTDKKAKAKTIIKKKVERIKKAISCPECNTIIQEVLSESKRCPFCNKKILTE